MVVGSLVYRDNFRETLSFRVWWLRLSMCSLTIEQPLSSLSGAIFCGHPTLLMGDARQGVGSSIGTSGRAGALRPLQGTGGTE